MSQGEPTFDAKEFTALSKAADALKRVRDAELKRAMKGVATKVQDITKEAAKVERCASVTDDKTLKGKQQQIKKLQDACSAVAKDLKKSKFSDAPEVADLTGKIQTAEKAADDFAKRLTTWFKSDSKKGGDITSGLLKMDMVARVDKKGAVTVPSTQSVSVEIIVQKVPQVIQTQFLDKLPQTLTTEARNQLSKWQQATTKNFQKWHADFAKYKREHDTASAKTLFKNINFFFKEELRDGLEKTLEENVAKYINRTLPASAKSLKPSITVKADYSDFADFVVGMSESHPADDLTDDLTGKLKKLKQPRQDYSANVNEIKEACGTIRTGVDNLDKAKETEKEKYETELKAAAEKLQKAIDSAQSNLDKIQKGVDAAGAIFTGKKSALQKQSSVDRRGLAGLEKSLVKDSKDRFGKASKALESLEKIKLTTPEDAVKNKKQFETATVGKLTRDLEIEATLGEIETEMGSLKA